mmetsp:Transcript_56132/g.64058  ORF Transcript_56132/g.64058 Transcript_56132/m.64058 type:complete len:381 (-) Transcript_56132:236-1378(-)
MRLSCSMIVFCLDHIFCFTIKKFSLRLSQVGEEEYSTRLVVLRFHHNFLCLISDLMAREKLESEEFFSVLGSQSEELDELYVAFLAKQLIHHLKIFFNDIKMQKIEIHAEETEGQVDEHEIISAKLSRGLLNFLLALSTKSCQIFKSKLHWNFIKKVRGAYLKTINAAFSKVSNSSVSDATRIQLWFNFSKLLSTLDGYDDTTKATIQVYEDALTSSTTIDATIIASLRTKITDFNTRTTNLYSIFSNNFNIVSSIQTSQSASAEKSISLEKGLILKPKVQFEPKILPVNTPLSNYIFSNIQSHTVINERQRKRVQDIGGSRTSAGGGQSKTKIAEASLHQAKDKARDMLGQVGSKFAGVMKEKGFSAGISSFFGKNQKK